MYEKQKAAYARNKRKKQRKILVICHFSLVTRERVHEESRARLNWVDVEK